MPIDLLLYLLHYFLSILIFTSMCIFIFAVLLFLCSDMLVWVIMQLFSNEDVLRNHFNLGVWGGPVAHPTSQRYVAGKYRKKKIKQQKTWKKKDMKKIFVEKLISRATTIFLGQRNKIWVLIGELEVLGRQPECYSSQSKCNNSSRKGISLHRLFNDLRMLPKKSMKTKKTQNMAFMSEQLFFEY